MFPNSHPALKNALIKVIIGLFISLSPIGCAYLHSADQQKRTQIEQQDSAKQNQPEVFFQLAFEPQNSSLFLFKPKRGLWQRIRSGFKLDLSDNQRIARERERYLRSPGGISLMLKRAEPYLHHIVDTLENKNIPLEIALLPAVESGFDPFAYSHGRASGIWQFIPGTGKMLGLEQNWWYDGRRDIVRSTDAAITYLTRHYQRFDNDWLLALASYNSGAGNVSKAIRNNKKRGQAHDYWSLKLPKETLAYVPRLLALCQIINTPDAFGIALEPIEDKPYFAAVDVGSQIDLSEAAHLAGMTIDSLYQLNPAFNQWASHPDGPYSILVEADKKTFFEQNLSKLPIEDRIQWQRYTIRSGDTLSTIAARNKLDMQTLKRLNKLHSNQIRAGKKLIIPVPAKEKGFYSKSIEERLEKQQTRFARRQTGQRIDYIVKSGDSFWTIAKRYGVRSGDIARWNGLAPKDLIRPGQKLVLWTDKAQADNKNQNAIIRKVAYTVRKGDSLARIAHKFSVHVNDIVSWNTINPNRYLQPGDSLTLFVDVTRVN